ncbi:MAG: hypothetical protein KatS3mg123_2771 [Burkholderiales bacterium]|nr:MAG: hypothetical protein KatS3mg123_2771 [Burkholderiales bacterium]
MKHIYGFWEGCHIDHTESTRLIANANLSDTRAHALHGFPVVWIETMLHFVELKPCLLAGTLGKSANDF